MKIPDPLYGIGQRVYHVTKESDQGVVLNCRYLLRQGYWIYVVSFSPGNECDLFEDEISNSKIY
jgi:hypothetical protein